jgi:hypothetical protein
MGIYEDFTYNSCKTLQLVVLNLRDLWDHYLIFRKTPWDILRGEKHPNDEAQSPQSLTLDTIDNLESVFFGQELNMDLFKRSMESVQKVQLFQKGCESWGWSTEPGKHRSAKLISAFLSDVLFWCTLGPRRWPSNLFLPRPSSFFWLELCCDSLLSGIKCFFMLF